MKLIWTLFVVLLALVSITIGFPSENTVEQSTTEETPAYQLKDKDGNIINCLETPGKSFYDGCNNCVCSTKPDTANSAACTLRYCFKADELEKLNL